MERFQNEREESCGLGSGKHIVVEQMPGIFLDSFFKTYYLNNFTPQL